MEIEKVLYPAFMDSFRCTGSSCPVTCCCSDWNIYIDRETWKRYRRLTEPAELVRQFSEKIVSCEPESDFKNALIDFEGYCPFLARGWCRIHQELGEAAMCEVCKTFPRLYRLAGNRLEYSGDPACPEIVRVILSSKKPLDCTVRDIFVFSNIRLQVETADVKPEQLAGMDLAREYLYECLGDPSRPFRQRLALVAMFLRLTGKSLDFTDPAEVEAFIGQFRKYLDTVSTEPLFGAGEFSPQFQSSLVLELRKAFQFKSVNFPPLEERVMRQFDIRDFAPSEDTPRRFGEAISRVLNPWLERHPAAWENLWQYFIWRHLYQLFTPHGFNEFIHMSIRFAVIRFYLAGAAAAAPREFTLDQAAETIAICERTFRNTPEVRKFLDHLITANEFDNIPFLLMLLRDDS